jgi:hypothetical protein
MRQLDMTKTMLDRIGFEKGDRRLYICALEHQLNTVYYRYTHKNSTFTHFRVDKDSGELRWDLRQMCGAGSFRHGHLGILRTKRTERFTVEFANLDMPEIPPVLFWDSQLELQHERSILFRDFCENHLFSNKAIHKPDVLIKRANYTPPRDSFWSLLIKNRDQYLLNQLVDEVNGLAYPKRGTNQSLSQLKSMLESYEFSTDEQQIAVLKYMTQLCRQNKRRLGDQPIHDGHVVYAWNKHEYLHGLSYECLNTPIIVSAQLEKG